MNTDSLSDRTCECLGWPCPCMIEDTPAPATVMVDGVYLCDVCARYSDVCARYSRGALEEEGE